MFSVETRRTAKRASPVASQEQRCLAIGIPERIVYGVFNGECTMILVLLCLSPVLAPMG